MFVLTARMEDGCPSPKGKFHVKLLKIYCSNNQQLEFLLKYLAMFFYIIPDV